MPRHAHSEATRLLSAGAHLSADFRRRVVDELVGHAERPVAPSLGLDVLTVLAHALRARRRELYAALALLLIWALFVAVETRMPEREAAPVPETSGITVFGIDLGSLSVSGAAPYIYAGLCLVLLLARLVLGKPAPRPGVSEPPSPFRSLPPGGWLRRSVGSLLTFAGRLGMLVYWAVAVDGVADDPFPLIFPLALALVVWVHRMTQETLLREELGRDSFAGARPTPLPDTPRLRRVREAAAREQHAKGALYDPYLPFVGAGSPHQPWSFALELKREKPNGTLTGKRLGDTEVPAQGAPPELTARRVIDLVRGPLEALRKAAAEGSVDRLRDLELDEFVYLPAGPGREEGFHTPESVAGHIAAAAGEGGEGRRHFLRIRIGAWDEQIVVTVFVRVHTQGRMLVLEVLPHVLGPVREEFRAADALAPAPGPADVARGAVRALAAAPTELLTLLWGGARTAVAVPRTAWEAPERGAPGAPLVSVRELGSAEGFSLFQEMDVSRYVKTVQDRIASGVRDALELSGFRTDRFEQYVVNVSDGGLFIGGMSGGYATGQVSGGAVAMGEHSRATTGGSGT